MPKRLRRIILPFLFMFAALPAAADVPGLAGDVEYLFGLPQKNETPFNPGNILSVPDRTHLLELRTRFTGGELLTVEWRGRYLSPGDQFFSYLDQAYLAAEAGRFRYRVGRQRIGFGPGFVWNPVNDLDKRKDVYNPSKYQEGVNAVKATADLASITGETSNASFEAVFPDAYRSISDARYVRLGSQLYVLTRDLELGLAASYGFNQDYEDSALIGAYGTADIGGMILGMEYAYAKKPGLTYIGTAGGYHKNGFDHVFLVNLNRRITETSFVLLEYYHNGFGYSNTELENVLSLVKSSYPAYGPLAAALLGPGYVSENYLYATVSQDLADYWSLSLSAMANLDRPGGFVYPVIAWTGIEDLTLSLEATTNAASSAESEFALDVYRTIYLFRAQYFF